MIENPVARSVTARTALERVHYFPRQLLTAADMLDEQHYFRQKLRLHNRFLHGWGVVCGCEVKAASGDGKPWRVCVCPGYVIDPQGNEIYIAKSVYFDLGGDWTQNDPCAPSRPYPPQATTSSPDVYLAVQYTECETRPVRVHPVGCACDEAACEYSRIQEDFRLARLPALPPSHTRAAAADEQWRAVFENWHNTHKIGTDSPPVPPCPECPEEPWVVLAKIDLPLTLDKKPARDTELIQDNIKDDGRRVLYSATALYLGL